jgi:hypothetical protein
VSTSPTSSQILLQDEGESTEYVDRIRWSWKRGTATGFEEFGDLAGPNRMALCLYDSSDELIQQYDVDTDSTCEKPPCWKEKTDSLSFKGAGLSFSLRAGAEGRSAMKLKSSVARFDISLPPPLPLRTQLRIDTGACFESVFSADGVTKEYPFKAKGSEQP